VPNVYDAPKGSASPELVTTEWGAAVLDEEVEKLRAFDNDEFNKIFGVICRCVGAHKGGHISEDDLSRELGTACAEIRYRKLQYDLAKAFVTVPPRGPNHGNAIEYVPSETPFAEEHSAEWANPVAVEALWQATVPAVLDDDAYRWLMLRGISPQEVEFQKLARFLPLGAFDKLTPEQLETVKEVLPRTKIGDDVGFAPRLGFRLVVPSYDHEGTMRSLRLRRTPLGKDTRGNAKLRKEPKSVPKELGLKGRAKGLVLANGPGIHLLRHRGQRDETWGDRELVVVITEGVPDFLVASCEPDEAVRAVFGICGPSCWSLEAAARVPFDARVEVATDSDPAGNKYAKEVIASLPERRKVSRWRPWSVGKNGQSKHDLSNVFGLRGGASHVVR
jgi:hypothetical protein